MTKRIAYLLMLFALAIVPAACNDNAEDHAEEAREEAASGDTEEAAEETAEKNRDLQQGDTTEGVN